MSWYALHVRSNCEPVVEESLRLAGIESFFPAQTVERTRGGAWRKPFFPGYVFAEADLTRQVRDLIIIPQVLRIVGSNRSDAPPTIPRDQIESVRTIVEVARAVQVEPSMAFTEGDMVRVERGPLAGITGYVIFRKNATRLLVAVTMLGQGVSAEVDATSLCVLCHQKTDATSSANS